MRARMIIAITLVLILVLALFCGCKGEEPIIDEGQFVMLSRQYIDSNAIVYILCDKNTKVMYSLVHCGYGTAMTIMVDENGNPLIYEGEIK